MAAPKRTKAQREIDLITVARMFCRGASHREIAQAIGVSRQQADYDCQTLLQRWRDETTSTRDIELAKINHLEATAWDAYERSCRDAETRIAKTVTTADGERTEATQREEGQVGDPRWLEIVRWCINRRCELLQLDPPKVTQQEYSGPGGSPILLKIVEAVVTTRVEAKALLEHKESDGKPGASPADPPSAG